MLRYLVAAVALPFVFLIYTYINSWYRSWRWKRQTLEKDCQLPYARVQKYPGGFDLINRMIIADKQNRIPEEFLVMHQEISKNTWSQYIFGDLSIFTSEPKNIQALLATQFKDFELGARREGVFVPMLGHGIFTQDGKAWERSRAMLRPQFARNQVSDLELEEKHVQDLFRHMTVDTSGWTAPLDLQPLFFNLTLDSATEFLFGKSVHTQLDSLPGHSPLGNEIGVDVAKFARCFDSGTHHLGKRGRLGGKYWLHNPSEFVNDCKVVQDFADHYAKKALAEVANVHGEKTDENDKYVFLHEVAKATQDPIELRSQLLNILLAGRDTTAGLLGWTFWLLARHPDKFDKLRNTVIETFGTGDDVTTVSFATLKNCSYLQHVLNETLRIFPTVPVNSRRATRDTTLPVGGGPDQLSPIFIPKGTQIDYAVEIMHRREDIWGPDVHEFKPERWQGRKVGWEYLPFNGGK